MHLLLILLLILLISHQWNGSSLIPRCSKVGGSELPVCTVCAFAKNSVVLSVKFIVTRKLSLQIVKIFGKYTTGMCRT